MDPDADTGHGEWFNDSALPLPGIKLAAER